MQCTDTTGLQKLTVEVDGNDAIIVCTFAPGSTSTGCQVSIMGDILANVTLSPSDGTVAMTRMQLPEGFLVGDEVSVSERLADGSISEIEMTAAITVLPVPTIPTTDTNNGEYASRFVGICVYNF